MARSDQRPSATSTLADAADPARRLGVAVKRYLDAHALHAARTPGDVYTAITGGPLPWLPPPPEPDGRELAEYLQRRADLVHALAAGVTAEQLPASDWARLLRRVNPELARQLAVWRAATGITEHPHPHGPAASPTPTLRRELAAKLPPQITAHLAGRTAAARRDALAGPARRWGHQAGRVQPTVRDRVPRPQDDPLLARAYQRDRDRTQGVRR